MAPSAVTFDRNASAQLRSVLGGDELTVKICFLSLFVMCSPLISVLMFEYLTEYGSVNIFSQISGVGLHAARVSKAHCCLNERLLTDLCRHENHMFFGSLALQIISDGSVRTYFEVPEC